MKLFLNYIFHVLLIFNGIFLTYINAEEPVNASDSDIAGLNELSDLEISQRCKAMDLRIQQISDLLKPGHEQELHQVAREMVEREILDKQSVIRRAEDTIKIIHQQGNKKPYQASYYQTDSKQEAIQSNKERIEEYKKSIQRLSQQNPIAYAKPLLEGELYTLQYKRSSKMGCIEQTR